MIAKMRKTRALPPRLRFSVLQRDRFTCQYCGRKAPDVVLHVDHILPKSRGGTDVAENLKTACADCNLGKSDVLSREQVIDSITNLQQARTDLLVDCYTAMYGRFSETRPEWDSDPGLVRFFHFAGEPMMAPLVGLPAMEA